MFSFLFNRSDFYKNVLTLMSGTVIAQIIPILLSPILSRLYSPGEFGVFSLFSSIASAVAVMATFRYELAIMLPEKDETAFSILKLAFTITISLSLVFSLLVLLLHDEVPLWLHTPELRIFIYYIPFFLFFAGGTQALTYWISRQKKFRLLAIGKVGQATIAGGLSIFLGYVNYSSLGLILGAVAGQLSSFLIFTVGSIRRIFSMKLHGSRSEVIESFLKYKTFMLVNTPHALLGVVQDVIVIFLINYFFSKTILGWYAFGYRILKVPAGFIGAAVFQVFFQRASTIKNDRLLLQDMTRKVYLRMSTVGIPVFLTLGLLAPQLFSLIFGDQWFQAGEIAQVLSPWLFLNFVIAPVAALSIILNKQQTAIWFTVVDTTLRVSAIVIGGLYHNYHLAFILLSALSGSLLIFLLIWFYRLPLQVKNIEYGT